MRHLVVIFVTAFLACHAVPAMAQSEAPMTDEKAKLMMRSAHLLWAEQGKPEEAVAIMEKVVAYNPRLKADFPGMHLRAQGGLAHACFAAEQWEKALAAFDLSEQFVQQESRSHGATFTPSLMADCRKRMALAGKPPTDTLIVIGGWVYRGSRTVSDGILLVPASELASRLGLRLVSDGADVFTLSIDPEKRDVDTDKKKMLRMTVGRKTAAGNRTILRLPTPPQKGSDGVLVPLRAVGEYWGCEVKWEPLSKVVYL